MPAWTFVASAHAATMAGLIPYFVDVDPDDVDHRSGRDRRRSLPTHRRQIGAVMPVVPFGRPIDTAAWDRFRSRTGLPVVIDAATGFDTLRAGAVPAVVSLHATKVFGVGEGGLVVSTDTAMIGDVRDRSNFGFAGTRSRRRGRQWQVERVSRRGRPRRPRRMGRACARSGWPWREAYRDALPESNRLRFQEGFGRVLDRVDVRHERGRAPRRCGSPSALERAGVENAPLVGRRGARAPRALRRFPRSALPVTEALAASTLAPAVLSRPHRPGDPAGRGTDPRDDRRTRRGLTRPAM